VRKYFVISQRVSEKKIRQAKILYKSTKKRIKNEKILEIVNVRIDLL